MHDVLDMLFQHYQYHVFQIFFRDSVTGAAFRFFICGTINNRHISFQPLLRPFSSSGAPQSRTYSNAGQQIHLLLVRRSTGIHPQKPLDDRKIPFATSSGSWFFQYGSIIFPALRRTASPTWFGVNLRAVSNVNLIFPQYSAYRNRTQREPALSVGTVS